ncbi:MAG: N-acetyl-anhydromuramyl-L-alanine amidase AmpD, partial [Paraglaciecola sp.]
MYKRVYQASGIDPVAKYLRLAVYCLAGIVIASCTSLSIEKIPSHNYNQRIKFLVLHFTGIDYQQSVTALVDEGGLSAHYLIPEGDDPTYPQKDLTVLQLVDETARAWHAGNSYWQGREDLNDQSIGIEIVHVGDCTKEQDVDKQLCLFEDYDAKQIELLITLGKDILRRNPDITPTAVVGHGDIAPTRKNDPGPRFPWYRLYKAGIGAWYDKDNVKHYWHIFNQHSPHIGLMQAGLRAYGYGVSETGVADAQTMDTLAAFQMHFLPWQVTGKVDSQTAAVLFALLEKYFPAQNSKLLTRYEAEKSAAPLPLTVLRTGQIEQSYPQDDPSSREWVNDREIFKSYKGKGQIIIDNIDATSADLFVNGQKLNIKTRLQPYQRYAYSLSRRTKEGDNTFKIDNIQPQGSQLKIT